MSKLLTTGQMLDRLKVGEIAETQDGFKVIKRIEGSVTWHHHGDDPKNYMTINNVALDFKWRILPNYVSFEEAFEAFKGGKCIYFHDGNWSVRLNPDQWIEDSEFGGYTFSQLVKGRWTIESDSK